MRLIDADKLVEEINERAEEECLEFRDIRGMVEYAPTVEIPQWIPVEKGLPSEDYTHEVLGCDTYGNIMIGYICEDEESETNYEMIMRKYFGFDYRINFYYMSSEKAYVLSVTEQCGKEVYGEKFSNIWNFLYWLGEEYNED